MAPAADGADLRRAWRSPAAPCCCSAAAAGFRRSTCRWIAWLQRVCACCSAPSSRGLLAAHRRRDAHATPPRPPPGSASSARCARSSRRTPSPTSSCARWAIGSRASTRERLRGLAMLLRLRRWLPSLLLLIEPARDRRLAIAALCGARRWRRAAGRALAVLRRSRACRRGVLPRRQRVGRSAGSPMSPEWSRAARTVRPQATNTIRPRRSSSKFAV